MDIKVCGLREIENAKLVAKLLPDYMGFIFYRKSKRYSGDLLTPEVVDSFSDGIKKVGVFVDERSELVIEIAENLKLDFVQLHGEEDLEYCKKLSGNGISIIKAFGIADRIEYDKIDRFNGVCSYYLFDNAGSEKGGTGKKFNWSLLKDYPLSKPFILSGGIGPNDIELLNNLDLKDLVAVDVNSKFEVKPGVKSIDSLKLFIDKIRNIKTTQYDTRS